MARVRGRWTPEQRAFIERFKREQQATAADVLRHIAAWYLERPNALLVSRRPAPSGQLLVKRETGLKVLDFMTTPSQAAAIKGAAGHLEEAAWLRRAVDLYREHGPLIKGAD